MHEVYFKPPFLLFWSKITYAEISAEMKKVSESEIKYDGCEWKDSVRPYGKEVRVFALQIVTFLKQSVFFLVSAEAKQNTCILS